MKRQEGFRYYDVVMAAFSVVIIISNIASSAKIVDLGVSVFGVRLAFDGGTLIFPIGYIIGDILTEVYGFRAARRVIWTGFALSAFTSGVFFVLSRLPAEAVWEAEAGGAAYNAILGGISAGGIVLASLAGFLAGEFSNSASFVWIKARTGGRFFFVRALLSTAVGELLDTFVFVSAATLFGVFPPEIFTELVLTNYLLKCAIEALCVPLTGRVASRLKKAEGLAAGGGIQGGGGKKDSYKIA
jgi:uncharacterized integral membrane protein (TIGR00697 family)